MTFSFEKPASWPSPNQDRQAFEEQLFHYIDKITDSKPRDGLDWMILDDGKVQVTLYRTEQ